MEAFKEPGLSRFRRYGLAVVQVPVGLVACNDERPSQTQINMISTTVLRPELHSVPDASTIF